VPRDHLSRGHQVVHVPAHLGAVALAMQTGGSGVPAVEVPAVLRRVAVGCDGDSGRGLRLVDGADGGLPRAEDGVGRDRRPTVLPVAGRAVRIRADVGEEEGGKHRPVAQVGVAGARRRVGARLVSVESRRADLGIEHAAGIRGEGRDGVVRGSRAGFGQHDDATDAERQGMLVVVPDLDREAGRRVDALLRAERAQDLALVEADIRAWVAALERIADDAAGMRRAGARGRESRQHHQRVLESPQS